MHVELCLTFRVQKLGQVQLLFGYVEGIVQVVDGVGLGQLLVLNQVWPVLVDQGVKGQAIPPAGGEIADVDVGVASRLHLAPEQEGVLGRAGLLVVFILKADVLDLAIKKSSLT